MQAAKPLKMGDKPYHNSGAELASRTDGELKRELAGSFPGGGRWDGLTYELARRGAAKQDRLLKWTFAVSVLGVLASVAGVLMTVLASAQPAERANGAPIATQPSGASLAPTKQAPVEASRGT